MSSHLHIVLQQPVCHFRQVGGFADPIYPNKDDGVRPPLGFGCMDLSHDVDGAPGCENARQSLLDGFSDGTADPSEALQALPHQILGY